MAGRFSRSWQLFRASLRVLADNKRLLLFPFFASIAAVLVTASLAGLAMYSATLDEAQLSDAQTQGLGIIALFVFYLLIYTIVFFFNTALVASTARILAGEDAGLGYGLAAAWAKLGKIVGYAAISATVGVLLRLLEERLPFVNRLVVGIIGAAWTIATYLVVPILVHRDIGPLDAVKQSAGLLRKTWGENIIANAGMGLAFGILYVLLGLALVASAMTLLVRTDTQGPSGAEVLVVSTVFGLSLVALIVLALVQAALQGIYGTALYRYAAGALGPEVDNYFSADLLGSAFGPK